MAEICESCCSVCLQPLENWPYSEDLATPNLALVKLPCGHFFHAECILDRELRLQRNLNSGEWEAASTPLIPGKCPVCRCSWSRASVEEYILGDFEDSVCIRSDEEDTGASVQADLPPPEQVRNWERYEDPDTGRKFWITNDEQDWFFEGASSWALYQSAEGQLWWSKVSDDSSWFYVSSGSKRL